MQALDAVGVLLLIACAVLLVLFGRRRWLARDGGVVEMSLRVRDGAAGSPHWTFGLGRYEVDRLLWFRTFSLSPRARHEMSRVRLRVRSRREPHAAEVIAQVSDAVVLECEHGDAVVEIALPASAALGFLSWLEAAPRTSHAVSADKGGFPAL